VDEVGRQIETDRQLECVVSLRLECMGHAATRLLMDAVTHSFRLSRPDQSTQIYIYTCTCTYMHAHPCIHTHLYDRWCAPWTPWSSASLIVT
jgi:hypothetical protein